MKFQKPSAKKGQVWTMDFFVGLFMFIFIIFTAISILKGQTSDKDDYYETSGESDHIASMLLSDKTSAGGNSNLSKLAIAENNRINITKLQDFDSMSYNQQKTLLQNSGDFVLYFYNGTVIDDGICFRGFAMTGCTLDIPASAENIAKTERLVILNSQIVKLIVITWK